MFARLRSASETNRRPPYATVSTVVDRCNSAPDLFESADLDGDTANILSYVVLDSNDVGQSDFVSNNGTYKKDKTNNRARADEATAAKSATGAGAQPPSYALLAPLAPRFPIMPREEEGRETLPDYTPSLSRSQLLNRKLELSSPFSSASQRSWHAVHVELNNTQLNFYAALRKSVATLGLAARDRSLGYNVGKLIKSYTLQYADVGVAIDYEKRPFVIRIRAETEQFLLECPTQEDCIVWINLLQMATDLALPLEERRLPKYRSIPRRNRGGRRHQRMAEAAEAQLVAVASANAAAGRPSLTIDSSRNRDSRRGSVISARRINDSSESLSLVARRGSTGTSALHPTSSSSSSTPRRNSAPARPKRLSRWWHSIRHHGHVQYHSYSEGMSSSSLAPVNSTLSLCPTETIASSYHMRPLSSVGSASNSLDPLSVETQTTLTAPANGDSTTGNEAIRATQIQFTPQLPPSQRRSTTAGDRSPSRRASVAPADDDDDSDAESVLLDTHHEPPQQQANSDTNALGMDHSLFLPNDDSEDTGPNDTTDSTAVPTTTTDSTSSTAVSNSTTSSTSSLEFKTIKWVPRHRQPSHESFLRYAQRCLGSLPAKTPWLNKTLVADGKKCIVRESYLERVATVQ